MFHGNSCGDPWGVYGASTRLPRFRGVSMGTSVVLPWCFHRTFVGLSWFFHGTIHGDSMMLLLAPMEAPSFYGKICNASMGTSVMLPCLRGSCPGASHGASV